VALIAVVGPNAALLEGVSQTLVGAAHTVVIAQDVPEAIELLRDSRPLVAIVECDEMLKAQSSPRIPLAPGGALICYHSEESERVRLPFELRRAALAELQLPLERQRLLALIKFVQDRAIAAGKSSIEDSPESALRTT
jgi:hypothetical protein